MLSGLQREDFSQMHRSRSTSASPTSGNIFSGVRFVLLGFDSVSEAQYRSELVRRGGVEVGLYAERCTHVIVSGRVYDDPVCVAAREDGKTLVTELWVDDCLELEMLVDATRILYKPVKYLNGIPGSESLHICLTGYQRQERDYVMKMVSLMGAKFTKPLIANQVTHLICYKFEGEKYELAKKVNIKLVNHRWLEDCLKTWQILPIDGYRKSGWELEVLENEAMDSEDEAGDIGRKLMRPSSVGTSVGGGKSTNENFDMHVSSMGRSAQKDILAERIITASDVGITNTALFATPSKEINPSNVLDDCEPRSRTFQQTHSGAAGQHAQMGNTTPGVDAISAGKHCMPADCNLRKEGAVYSSAVASTSTATEGKLSYSRQTQRKLSSPDQPSVSLSAASATTSARGKPEVEYDGSSADAKEDRTHGELAKTPTKASDYHVEQSGNALPQKVCTSFSGANLNSPKSDCQIVKSPIRRSPFSINSDQLKATAFSPQGKYNFVPEQENSALEYAVFSNSANKCGNALPQKSKASFTRPKSNSPISADAKDGRSRTNCELVKTPTKASGYHVEQSGNVLPQKGKASFSGANSNSPKSDCQIVKSIRQSPFSINPDQLEATAFSPQGKYNFVPEQENSALEYAAFSNSANKCGIALPWKRKASFSKPKSNSPKSDCQIVKSPMQQSLRSVKCDQLEATAFPPQEKEHFVPEQEKTAFGYAAVTNSLTKQQGRSIRSKSLSNKRSLKQGKAVQESEQPNKIVSLSEKPGKPTLRLGSDGQKDNLKPSPAKLATVALLDFLLHNEQDDCMPKITRNPRNQLYSSVIDGSHADATSCVNMDSDKPLNKLDENNPATGTGNIYANDNTHNISLEKPAKIHKRRQQEEGGLLGHDAADKSVSHVTADTPNKEKLHVKKAVAKRSMNRTKHSLTHNRKSEQNLHLEKNDISNQSPFKSGETEESKGLTKFEKVKLNMMDSEVIPFSEDVVMMNRTEVPGHHVSMDLMDMSSDADKEIVASSYSNCQNDLSHNVVVLNQDDLKFLKFQESVCKIESTRNKDFVRLEQGWFILSGHRLQRKEFQGMIKQLRGRVFKDSHKWSYQATHFVVPDPLRRTEKFFAAAAAGRWILKTDYLTASKEAGKFLYEEPYEWYSKGLTQDGAISLEAPRKWRLLRERTGHGALYGMQIIIYGDCIAPTLDTLKRVVKAGDGTIVATSPPYSRFIQSGVDYAVVSPSMPRVDCWIQEFLRHEIPCISSDYLVEYICKPGYSLERHVLYNTHSWAEKSSGRLSSLSEEITKDALVVYEEINDDLSCAVCRSCDRGEVMLICGNEAGTVGCGIGNHIDCCDPPLEAVPEEDWFCQKCLDLFNEDPLPKSKKKKSVTKRK